MLDDRITQAKAHLRSAEIQLMPTDDAIIADHIRAAHALLASYCRSARVAPLAKAEGEELSMFDAGRDNREEVA